MTAEHNALAYLIALAPTTGEGFFELRFQRPGREGMRRRFYPVTHARAAAREAARRAAVEDVYVGVAVRARELGGKDGIDSIRILWADCDDDASIAALGSFDPRPSIVVASGRGRHALWLLTHALTLPAAEWANREIARTLGACRSAVTNAAAILRPPGTFNHKYGRPIPVDLLRLSPDQFDAADLVGQLPDLPLEPLAGQAIAHAGGPGEFEALEELAPRVYARLLTGQVAGRDGKIKCPFHAEGKPSCHLYETAAAGFYCFGCRVGGDVYSFGSRVLGIPNTRRDRLRLRRELYARLLPGVPVPPWRRSETRHAVRLRAGQACRQPLAGARR